MLLTATLLYPVGQSASSPCNPKEGHVQAGEKPYKVPSPTWNLSGGLLWLTKAKTECGGFAHFVWRSRLSYACGIGALVWCVDRSGYTFASLTLQRGLLLGSEAHVCDVPINFAGVCALQNSWAGGVRWSRRQRLWEAVAMSIFFDLPFCWRTFRRRALRYPANLASRCQRKVSTGLFAKIKPL